MDRGATGYGLCRGVFCTRMKARVHPQIAGTRAQIRLRAGTGSIPENHCYIPLVGLSAAPRCYPILPGPHAFCRKPTPVSAEEFGPLPPLIK